MKHITDINQGCSELLGPSLRVIVDNSLPFTTKLKSFALVETNRKELLLEVWSETL